MFGVNILFE